MKCLRRRLSAKFNWTLLERHPAIDRGNRGRILKLYGDRQRQPAGGMTLWPAKTS